MSKLSPEDFAEKFELLPGDKKEFTAECAPVSFWIPRAYKAKYDLIQSKSKHKFGKFLREVIKKSIDNVVLEKKSS